MSPWTGSRRLLLNTAASGANVSGTVYRFPVLVRLSAATFDFSAAKPGGEDIRFTKSDAGLTEIPFEIEQWDRANARAALWVLVDTVRGGSATQSLFMFWGNPAAADASSPASVFDTTNGFQGVWHLAQAGNTIAPDATPNGYDGVPSGMTAASAVAGTIGIGQRFDGVSSCITMPNTAQGRLNFAEDAPYTLSAWVYVEALDTGVHMIAGKGHEQYYMDLKHNQGAPKWEIVEYGVHDSGMAWKASGDTVPVAAREWRYIAGVHAPAGQTIYNNGAYRMYENWYRMGDTLVPRNTGENVSIGRHIKSVQSFWEEGYCAFNGIIDEVRVSSVARSADWIKLEYMNQKPGGDALVVFGK
jgi:hypothetical protein